MKVTPACDATRTEYPPHVAPEYKQRSILYPVTEGPPAGAPHVRVTLVGVVVADRARTPASVEVPVAETYAQTPN